MEKNFSPTIYENKDPAITAAAETAKSIVQAKFQMALYKPRSEDQSRINILNACKRPEFAAKVQFTKPVSGRKIKGLSIRFAEVAAKEWRNIDTTVSLIYEDEVSVRFKVSVLDLETNSSFNRDIQVNKTVERKKAEGREVVKERLNTKGEKVYIVLATEDEVSNKMNSLISKVIRNEVLRLIPSDIKEEAVRTALETLRNKDASDPDAAKKKILDGFAEIGVKPTQIEDALGHPLDTISPSELQNLREIYTAIKDGEGSWYDYFAAKKANKKDSLEEMAEKKKGNTMPNMNANGETEEVNRVVVGTVKVSEAQPPPTCLSLTSYQIKVKNALEIIGKDGEKKLIEKAKSLPKPIELYVIDNIKNKLYAGLNKKECEKLCALASGILDEVGVK